jgi:hypothetical protein
MFKSEHKNILVGKEVIPVEQLNRFNVDLTIGIGNLKVGSTSNRLMEAEFVYPTKELKPEVSYQSDKMLAKLKVAQPDSVRISLRKYKYDWNVLLNKETPIDLSVLSGAAKTYLNLRDINIRSLNVQMGIGGSTIDLSGDRLQGFKGTIQGGVGKTKIILPKNVGVKLGVDRGIGKVHAKGLYIIGHQYLNPCYEKADVKIDLQLEIGVGSVELELEK